MDVAVDGGEALRHRRARLCADDAGIDQTEPTTAPIDHREACGGAPRVDSEGAHGLLGGEQVSSICWAGIPVQSALQSLQLLSVDVAVVLDGLQNILKVT